jgi:hypothetical protein
MTKKNSKLGRKPSFFRKSFDSRLSLMTKKSSFLVRLKPGTDSDYLQRLVSSYVVFFQDKDWSKRFRTEKTKSGIRVYRIN